jgi:hypothetical protein
MRFPSWKSRENKKGQKGGKFQIPANDFAKVPDISRSDSDARSSKQNELNSPLQGKGYISL